MMDLLKIARQKLPTRRYKVECQVRVAHDGKAEELEEPIITFHIESRAWTAALAKRAAQRQLKVAVVSATKWRR